MEDTLSSLEQNRVQTIMRAAERDNETSKFLDDELDSGKFQRTQSASSLAVLSLIE